MDVSKKRRKKGEGRESAFKKNQRAEGKTYENNKKVIVPPKQVPPVEVSCRCRYECKNVDFEQKLKIFNQFYEVGDSVKQNSYLMGLLNISVIKYRRHGSYTDPEASRRQATIYFTIPDGTGVHKQVCKKTFLEVHGITKRRVETLVKAKKWGDITYIERTGNKSRERKYTAEDVKRIIEHIEVSRKRKAITLVTRPVYTGYK